MKKTDEKYIFLHLLTSSSESGIFLSFVSGRKRVRAPEVMAITVKMRVGMAGWISARAATVVDRVPPSYSKVKYYLRISRLYLDVRPWRPGRRTQHQLPALWSA